MTARTLALVLSTALLALPSLVAAEPMSTATVIGSRHAITPISLAGPDAAGRYSVKVNIADLNPASAEGWAAMQARAHRAALALCDVTADSSDMKGFYDGGARRCRDSTKAAALGQMSNARNAAASGQPVAMVAISALVATR